MIFEVGKMNNNVYMIDYNSKSSLMNSNLPVRKYPRLFPIPNTVVNSTKEFIIPAGMEDFEIYPELFGIINKNNKVDYGVNFAIWTNQLVNDCNNPTSRDIIVNTYYGYYWDGTKLVSPLNQMLKNNDIRKYEVELNILIKEKIEKYRFNMNKLLFSVEEVIKQMKRFIEFYEGDLIFLGRVEKGIFINRNIHVNNLEIKLNIPEIIERTILIKGCE